MISFCAGFSEIIETAGALLAQEDPNTNSKVSKSLAINVGVFMSEPESMYVFTGLRTSSLL